MCLYIILDMENGNILKDGGSGPLEVEKVPASSELSEAEKVLGSLPTSFKDFRREVEKENIDSGLGKIAEKYGYGEELKEMLEVAVPKIAEYYDNSETVLKVLDNCPIFMVEAGKNSSEAADEYFGTSEQMPTRASGGASVIPKIMEDGQIKGGNTTGNGGGILNNGNITLYGGKITGNKAKGLGGGIYNNKENTATEGFWMTGGLIADNTAINYPAIGGQVSFNTLVIVQVDAMGKQLSAKTAIAGLKKYDYIQPVMMDPVKFALLAELHEALGDEVWTGYGTATGVISYSRGSEPNEFKAVFMGGTYSVDLPFGDVVSISKVANPDESFTYTMVANVPPATGLETETVQVTIKDGQITGLASENAGIEMVKESDTPLTDWASLRTAMSNGGVIKLTQDYVAGSSDQALVVPAGKTVVLELNGHTINRALNAPAENGSVIINEGTLAIMGDESGKITGGNTTGYGGGIYNAGTLTLYGGEITGNRANAGAGVFNKKENTETEGFWMTGGLIDNNEADTYPAIGGDVYFNTLAVIQIDAEGNTASPAMAIMQLPNLNYIQPVMPADIDELGKPTIMVNYLGGEHGGQYDHEIAELENHDAPVIEGFTFIRWDFVGGLLADGIKLQAIYKSNNENAPAQVTVGDYTLVRPSNNNEYILQ